MKRSKHSQCFMVTTLFSAESICLYPGMGYTDAAARLTLATSALKRCLECHPKRRTFPEKT